MKDITKLFIAFGVAIFLSLWIYFLYAICLGPNPYTWEDDSYKKALIALEILIPGGVFVLMLALMYENKK